MSTTPQETAIVKPEAPTSIAALPMNRHGVQLQTIEDLFRFSKAVVAAGLAPKGLEKVESVFIAIQMGMELGISPMAAIQNIGVINGKPKIYGSMPLAMVRASGHLEWIKETIEGTGDSRKAVCVTKRKGEADPKTSTFSVDDAKKAGLWGKNTWSAYPERMLMYRARGFNLDDNFSDVLKGMASHDMVIDVQSEVVTPRVKDLTAKHPIDESCAPVETRPEPTPEPEVIKEPTGFRSTKAYQKIVEGFTEGNWQDIEIHFGTKDHPVKGYELGDLYRKKGEEFLWLINQWEPQPQADGKVSLQDQALRAACDAAQKQLQPQAA